jgi:hypothetical protein
VDDHSHMTVVHTWFRAVLQGQPRSGPRPPTANLAGLFLHILNDYGHHLRLDAGGDQYHLAAYTVFFRGYILSTALAYALGTMGLNGRSASHFWSAAGDAGGKGITELFNGGPLLDFFFLGFVGGGG